VELPTASPAELIVAALKDVTTELKRPENSIINISDTNVNKLTAITNALTNIITQDDDATFPNTNDEIEEPPAPPQRVATMETSPAVQRVPTKEAPTQVKFAPLPPAFAPSYQHPNLGNKSPIDTARTNNLDRWPEPRKMTNIKKSPIDAAHANNLDEWPNPRIVDGIIKQQQQLTQLRHQHFTRQSARTAYIEKMHFAGYGNAINPDTGLPAEYPELIKSSDGTHWMAAGSDEMGRLTQGNGTTMQNGTETMEFMFLQDIPKGTKITYARIVVADRPEKPNPRRVRLTIGGDRVEYDGITSTKAAELPTAKLVFNSVISTPNARFMTIDIKDFFLQTARMPEKDFAYMKIAMNVIPDDIIQKYNLLTMAHNGFVYVRVVKGMYGLPQAGKLANDQLIKQLAPFGYAPCKCTPGLWTHSTRDITFLLVVDDFGVKYTKRADAEHLITSLQTAYKISTEWEGDRYIGLNLKWDYHKHTCDISMPGYIERVLARFNHPTPKKPQHNPSKFYQPEYGARVQYAPDDDTSPLLDAKEKKRIQEILGSLLYAGRACDNTLLYAISILSSQQANATEQTRKDVNHLLDYCSTHPNAIIRYKASDMILHTSSDASYNGEPKAKSRSAGFHYLSQHPGDKNLMHPTLNGPILVTSVLIQETVASAAEAELAALFHNSRDAIPMIRALEEMGHPQPPTPIQCDNSTAVGISNDSVKQKMAKHMDMRYFWVQDQVKLGKYKVYWNKGKTNLADYFTKLHPTSHHQDIRSVYVYDKDNPLTNENYFDRMKQNSAAAKSATHYDMSDSTTDCAKGVLISYSGLHPETSSEDTDSYVLYDQQSHAYVLGDIGRAGRVYGDNTVDHTIGYSSTTHT
jgi:hypothetical protein